jgi:hypothetical protein
MKHRYRLLVALLIAGVWPDLANPPARTDGSTWQTSDLFAGVGRANVLRGDHGACA